MRSAVHIINHSLLTIVEERGHHEHEENERETVEHEVGEDGSGISLRDYGPVAKVDAEEEEDDEVDDEAGEEGGQEPGDPVQVAGEAHHAHEFLCGKGNVLNICQCRYTVNLHMIYK